MIKNLIDAMLYFVTFVLVLILWGDAFGAGLVVKDQRHFIAERKWYAFKEPTEFIIETQAFNNGKRPVRVRPVAVKASGESLRVEPEEAYLFSDGLQTFKIHVPWVEGTSFMGNFSLLPAEHKTEGMIVITSVLSHSFAVSILGKGESYEMKPVVKISNGILVVGNPSKWIAEVTVTEKDGQPLQHFFIKAGGYYEMSLDENLDSVFLDITGVHKRYGVRLQK